MAKNTFISAAQKHEREQEGIVRGAGREKAESTYEKRRKDGWVTVNVRVPVEMHKMMKLHSLLTGESYVDLLNRLLTAEFGDDPTVMADELARRTRDGE